MKFLRGLWFLLIYNFANKLANINQVRSRLHANFQGLSKNHINFFYFIKHLFSIDDSCKPSLNPLVVYPLACNKSIVKFSFLRKTSFLDFREDSLAQINYQDQEKLILDSDQVSQDKLLSGIPKGMFLFSRTSFCLYKSLKNHQR